jgi:hypothetical protein
MTLLVPNHSTLSVSFDATAAELKENALAAAALIGRVNSPEEQAEAVEAQKALKSLLDQVEKSRKHAKEPVLAFSRDIDAKAKAFCADPAKELERVSILIGNYQTFLERKRMAEEQKRNAELLEIERKKQEELAAATKPEQLEEIDERYCNEVAAMKPPLQVVRADGQVVNEDWDFEVIDAWALCRAFPNCIKPEPIRSEIKRMLNAGHKLPGVKAEKKIKSTVRLSPGQKLIEA